MKKSLGTRLEDLLRQRGDAGLSSSAGGKETEQAQAFFAGGVDLLKQARYFEALPPLFAALALRPDFLKAANNLALAFWHLECPRLAMEMTRLVLARDPQNMTAKKHLAFMEDVSE